MYLFYRPTCRHLSGYEPGPAMFSYRDVSTYTYDTRLRHGWVSSNPNYCTYRPQHTEIDIKTGTTRAFACAPNEVNNIIMSFCDFKMLSRLARTSTQCFYIHLLIRKYRRILYETCQEGYHLILQPLQVTSYVVEFKMELLRKKQDVIDLLYLMCGRNKSRWLFTECVERVLKVKNIRAFYGSTTHETNKIMHSDLMDLINKRYEIRRLQLIK